MKVLRRGGIVLLAVAVLGIAPVLATAAPADGEVAVRGTAATWIDWVPAWLAQWAPSWLIGGSETEPAPQPSPGIGIQLDDPQNMCTSPDDPGCREGETLPDFDPFG